MLYCFIMALTILYIASQQWNQTFKQILNDIETTLHQLQIDLYKPNLLHFRFMKKLDSLPKVRALASKESQLNEILSKWHAFAFNIKCIWKCCLQNVSHFCSGLNVMIMSAAVDIIINNHKNVSTSNQLCMKCKAGLKLIHFYSTKKYRLQNVGYFVVASTWQSCYLPLL